MTIVETERVTNILRQKLEELGASRCHRKDIAIEKASDTLDEIQLKTERELAISSLQRDSKMVRQIRLALSRIADEDYGVCLYCDDAIAPKRMVALPWAIFCIKCQEKIDRREVEFSETLEWLTAPE